MKIFKVSELNQAIKDLIEPQFSVLQVKGEVTNIREQSSGHMYFTLKDEHSQISAVIFKGLNSTLSKKPKPGDQIIVFGELSIYSPRGSYQIIVRKVEFDGIGNLLLKLHQLKEKLKAKGYFNQERKKPIPSFPKVIGVVTSPTGSVIQDILHVLNRRFKGFQLILNPAKVQGEGAALEIAKAIDEFNEFNNVDVIIIGRGGGSIEDLWPFNEEIVADSIYLSKIPIISAVGHETDFSISDYVADLRAPTPSAAAEIVVKEASALVKHLGDIKNIITKNTKQIIEQSKLRLERFTTHPILSSPEGILFPKWQQIDEISFKLSSLMINKMNHEKTIFKNYENLFFHLNPVKTIRQFHQKLPSLQDQLFLALTKVVEKKRERFYSIKSHLHAINPNTVLKKGYCIPFMENKSSVIMSSSQARENQKAVLVFHDGEVDVAINKKEKVYD